MFNVTEEQRDTVLLAGSTGTLTFQFRLSRSSLNVIKYLSSDTVDDESKNIIVTATIDLTYHGNDNSRKKRVVAIATPIPAHTSAFISLLTDIDEGDVGQSIKPLANDDDNDMWDSSSSVVGTTSVVGVIMVVLLLLF